MRKILWLLPLIAAAQTESDVVMVSPESANWQHDAAAPPDAQSVELRGETEMLVRYEGGHKFAPHWHSANERMVVIEGAMEVEVEGVRRQLGPGSYAYLPARKEQKETCISKTRCGFYLFFDGPLDFHR